MRVQCAFFSTHFLAAPPRAAKMRIGVPVFPVLRNYRTFHRVERRGPASPSPRGLPGRTNDRVA